MHQVCEALEFTFVCPLANGFHARPASNMAAVANRFVADCSLMNLRSGSVANGKSVLSLIAADIRKGDECQFRVSGMDDKEACAALRRFVEHDLPACDEPLTEIATDRCSGMLPRALKLAGVNCYFGLSLSRGIGQGKVLVAGDLVAPRESSTETAAESWREQEQVDGAIAAVRARIEAMLLMRVSTTESAVLKAHLAMLGDITLKEKLSELIAQGLPADRAVEEAGQFFSECLRQSESLYIRERALDIQDLCLQLAEEINGTQFRPAALELSEPSVVVADILTPQQLLGFERRWLTALVLESAAATSHTIILASSLDIPTLVAVKDASLILLSGQEVIVDANRGLVVAELTPPVRRFYARELNTLRRRLSALERHSLGPAITADGRRLEVAANVSSAEELIPAFERGADAIGLFRTEFLYVGRETAPSEEEQVAVYLRAARHAAGRSVIIRTFDIGGDKPAPYLKLPRETNPFLGYRGVRIYPEHQDLIRTQLRSILRASAYGRLQMLIPMVSSIEEVLSFKQWVAEVQDELKGQQIDFDAAMPIGIMIEVPSVAFILAELCAEVDFFSIGTNDLCQYFLAMDRDNARVAKLSSVGHPGFVRFLKQIVDRVHEAGKWVGMCGEMAGDIRQLPLLVGLGLDEISVTASRIPALKQKITRLSATACEQFLSRTIDCRQVEQPDNVLERSQPTEAELPLLDLELVILNDESESKEEVIRQIIDALYVAGRTEDRELLEDAVHAREATYSTGVGYGFAIPHCKTSAVSCDSIGILKLRRPVEWDSLDGQPVQVVILMALRESATAANKHMQVFARLARKLMDKEFRDQLLVAQDANTVLTHVARELGLQVETSA
ncbi:MAG TPA: phosphoenolpyruvate--protein phosphotransferase [Pyrinomonadaceae bacterium]